MIGNLIDTFGRVHQYLRVSLTDRCNFRCRYCMPESGVEWLPTPNLLTDSEVLRMIGIFSQLGVKKVRFTGGEPTLRPNLENLIDKTKVMTGIETVALTTNGYTLNRKASAYKHAGLDIINISLDSLNHEIFQRITLRNHLDQVLAGIESAINTGFQEVKLNMVVMRGINDHEILDFVRLAKNWPISVRFIEFMPFVGNRWSEASLLPYADIRKTIESEYKLDSVQSDPSAVGKDFHIAGFSGKIGFVTSMTETFCGDCDRIRLTADGSIKPCLFSPIESNVRELLRKGESDEIIVTHIQQALKRKPREHQPMIQLTTIQERSMIQIGG